MFTCNNGQCVDMSQRCNQLPHCEDTSDEVGCDILIHKDGYNARIPPISPEHCVEVKISIDILKLVDIKEEDYSIDIQFQITLVWKENRANYRNLKPKTSLNALLLEDIKRLWLPQVVYENTDQKITTRLGVAWEWETNVEIRREGPFILSGLETVDENYVYKGENLQSLSMSSNNFQGDENSLIMNQTYTHEFQCQYDFKWYPFDTQARLVCKII